MLATMADPKEVTPGSDTTGTPSPRLTPEEINTFLAEQWRGASMAHQCVDAGDGWAVVRRAFSQDTVRPGGILSGPTQFAVADLALWCAAFTAIGLEPMAVTSELSIRFLRPATAGDLFARAELDKVGRTSLVGTIRLWTPDAPNKAVSVAQGTYARPRPT